MAEIIEISRKSVPIQAYSAVLRSKEIHGIFTLMVECELPEVWLISKWPITSFQNYMSTSWDLERRTK